MYGTGCLLYTSLLVCLSLFNRTLATYECLNFSPEFKYLRPPERDCAKAIYDLMVQPGVEDERLFVTEEYSTKLPIEIVVPKSWRSGGCLVTVYLKERIPLESSSLEELGKTSQILVLECLLVTMPDSVAARADFGSGNELVVLLHGNAAEYNTTIGKEFQDTSFSGLNETAGNSTLLRPDADVA